MSGAENPPNNVETTLLMEKNIQGHLLKMVMQTLFGTIVRGIGTTAMEFYSRRKRLGSTLNTAQAGGKL